MLGTSTSSSISPLTMMRNRGSACSDAIAPTIAVLRVTIPPTGARNVIVAGAAGGEGARPAADAAAVDGTSEDCRASRASGCPDVTRSPSATRISAIRYPSASSITRASSRGTRNPVTRIVSEKQPLTARATMTIAPGVGGGAGHAFPFWQSKMPAASKCGTDATAIRRAIIWSSSPCRPN
jgi:hypothetical protein